MIKGLLTRNWMILQNYSTGKKDKIAKDLKWLKVTIRALWTYSNTLWIERCKQINKTTKDDPLSLTHVELQILIRKYLNIERLQLSLEEKRLHLNITKTMKFAHTKTLAKWLELLRTERESTLRRKREDRREKHNQTRPIIS